MLDVRKALLVGGRKNVANDAVLTIWVEVRETLGTRECITSCRCLYFVVAILYGKVYGPRSKFHLVT